MERIGGTIKATCILLAAGTLISGAAASLQIHQDSLFNKIKGAWLGKIAGVCIGAPTEFGAQGVMYNNSINMYPSMNGGFGQDDIYVQLTLIAEMDKHLTEPLGVFATTQVQYGKAFTATNYPLW